MGSTAQHLVLRALIGVMDDVLWIPPEDRHIERAARPTQSRRLAGLKACLTDFGDSGRPVAPPAARNFATQSLIAAGFSFAT